MTAHPALDAESDALSREPVERSKGAAVLATIKRSLSKVEGGLLA